MGLVYYDAWLLEGHIAPYIDIEFQQRKSKLVVVCSTGVCSVQPSDSIVRVCAKKVKIWPQECQKW